ncbi:MAG: dihydrofolate reductase family protein [Ilumatobacteraceae bacterium]
MGRTIIVTFTSLDGVVDDPDGTYCTPHGGWALRAGPAAMGGDKFHLGEIFPESVVLLGRVTWDLFSQRWPGREGEFAEQMNAVDKHVMTTHDIDVSAWSNSSVVTGTLEDEIVALTVDRNAVVIGSLSIARRLLTAGLVDEIRFLVFPVVVGSGDRLIVPDNGPLDLELQSVEHLPPTTMLTYSVARRPVD